MSGGAERHAHHLALEIGELEVGRVLVDHEPIARSVLIIGGNCDQPALAFRIGLEREAVHNQRIVAHHAELQLVRHHAIGDGRPGGEVVPLELELDAGVLAVLRQVFLQELELADDGPGRDSVGRGILRADPDLDDSLRVGGIHKAVGGDRERNSRQLVTQVLVTQAPAHDGTSDFVGGLGRLSPRLGIFGPREKPGNSRCRARVD